MVEVQLSGAFPRSEKLVATTRAFERGKANQDDVNASLREDNLSLASLQKDSALDFCVDGQLNWQDLLRPFSELFTGIEPGRLTRWFDNNTFYRAPIVTGKISFKGGNVDKFFRADAYPKNGQKKVVLPSPFAFAALAENKDPSSFKAIVDEFSHALRDLTKSLGALGYSCFQFSEPSLCAKMRTEEDFAIARNGIQTCAKGLAGKTILHTYFADASRAIVGLIDFPVDFIGIDFYATSLDAFPDVRFNRGLVCGCLDGRNSLMETPKEIHGFITKVREKLEPKGLVVAPNSDLDFLPQSVAEKKVRLLGKIRELS
jgi:5-methyltetrahydropteroyltriglutamate--homocysteine methyltransferase